MDEKSAKLAGDLMELLAEQSPKNAAGDTLIDKNLSLEALSLVAATMIAVWPKDERRPRYLQFIGRLWRDIEAAVDLLAQKRQ